MAEEQEEERHVESHNRFASPPPAHRSLSTACTIFRERMGGFVSPVVGIHPLAAGIYTGSFMALVSNIRYNLLQHVMEPFIEVRSGPHVSNPVLINRPLTPRSPRLACPADENKRLVDENGSVRRPRA